LPNLRTTPARTSSKKLGTSRPNDVDEIIVRMPTPAETDRLSIQAGTPVAEHRRAGYTSHDKAVRVMISIIPGDTLVLRYVVAT
jgi:GntR family transcriptional regulator